MILVGSGGQCIKRISYVPHCKIGHPSYPDTCIVCEDGYIVLKIDYPHTCLKINE